MLWVCWLDWFLFGCGVFVVGAVCCFYFGWLVCFLNCCFGYWFGVVRFVVCLQVARFGFLLLVWI